MAIPRAPILIVVLALSLLGNVFLGGRYYLKAADADLYREAATGREEERDFLMRLIPGLGPSVSKAQLAAEIRSRYSREQVNVLDTEVQWRLFHFWFGAAGKLVDVRWGS